MTKFGFVTYDIQTPHGLVFIILRYCYYLLRLPLKSLKYKFHLLYDQLTYFDYKEHMLNSTKRIITTTNFMVICPLDHPRKHVVLNQ